MIQWYTSLTFRWAAGSLTMMLLFLSFHNLTQTCSCVLHFCSAFMYAPVKYFIHSAEQGAGFWQLNFPGCLLPSWHKATCWMCPLTLFCEAPLEHWLTGGTSAATAKMRPHCRLHSALPPISSHPTSKWLYFRHRKRVTWKRVRVANTVSVEMPGMLIPCRRWKIHVIGISFSKALLTCKGNITFQF